MAIFKKDNVIIHEDDKGKIAELKAQDYKEVKEADLKPAKKSEKASSK